MTKAEPLTAESKVCECCGAVYIRKPLVKNYRWKTGRLCSSRCAAAAAMGTRRKPFDDYWMPEPMSGCHLWVGTAGKEGYGQFRRDGKLSQAHRYAWERANGPIPPGLFICHRCDVPACVNPDHLFPGTVVDNNKDTARKGHLARQHGESNGRARLTEADVREIRASSLSHTALAHRFGVSKSAVDHAKKGRNWGGLSSQGASAND